MEDQQRLAHQKSYQQNSIEKVSFSSSDLPYFQKVTKGNAAAEFTILITLYSALSQRYFRQEEPLFSQNLIDKELGVHLSLGSIEGVTLKQYLQRVTQEVQDAYNNLSNSASSNEESLDNTELLAFSFNHDSAGIDANRLHLQTTIDGRELRCSLYYENAHLEGEVASHFLRNYEKWLVNLEEYLALEIANIPILTDEELTEQLKALEYFKTDYPKDKTIVSLFLEQVIATPNNVALKYGDKEYTYLELDERSSQLAHYLIERYSVLPEELVGINLDRSEWQIISILAVLKSGGCYVPIDPEYPEERIEYILSDSQCKLCIDKLEIESFWKTHRQYATTTPDVKLNPSNLAYIIYTSGTTGKPKGTMVEHVNVVRLFKNANPSFDFNDQDTWTLFHSFCFDFSVWEIFGALLFGGKLIVVPSHITKDPDKFLELIIEEQVTVLNQTPTAFYNLMDHSSHVDKVPLRYIIFGGEKLNPKRLKEWAGGYPNIKFVNMYGITETTVHVTYHEVSLEEMDSPSSNIGEPIPTTTCYILDEFQQLVPTGVIGEIYVGGAGVTRGYLNRSELTNERFLVDPFDPNGRLYRTGDLAKWKSDFSMEYLGRADDQIKIRGYRVELEEIANALLELPAEINQAVIDFRLVRGEKMLVAYFVGQEIATVELRTLLEGKLPHYMVPKYYIRVPAVPLTKNGKVDKKALPDVDTQDVNQVPYVSPRNHTEEALVEIWQEVLTLDKVGVNDDFFDLGGHSLLVGQVTNRIYQTLGKSISVKEFFEKPKISEISVSLNTVDYAPIPSALEADYYPLTDTQRRIWVLSQIEGGNAAYNISSSLLLTGDLEVDKLEISFKQLIDRYEILRTFFKINPGGDVGQFVVSASELTFQIEYQDFKSKSSDQVDTYLQSYLIAPFDLEQAPLLKASIVKIGDGKHLFSIVMHHIVSDGWSVELLTSEVIQIYNNLVQGKEYRLDELHIQYKDYATWLLAELRDKRIAVSEKYWLKEFEGKITHLKLPTFKERPKTFSYQGGRYVKIYSPEFLLTLNQFARQSDATLFMTLMAGVNALLYRYTGQQDIIIGTPIAGRDHPDLEGQLGLFLNTLAIRTIIPDNGHFEGLLVQQKKKFLAAYENQGYPFDMLVDKLDLERDPSRSVLFDVMMVFQSQSKVNSIVSNDSLHQIKIEEYDVGVIPAHVDLSFNFREGDGLELTVVYNKDIYDLDIVERMTLHFENLILAAISESNTNLEELQYLPLQEQETLLHTFNRSHGYGGKDVSLIDLFSDVVSRHSDTIALSYEATELTYQRLDEVSSQLAHYIKDSYGIKPEDRIGILLERGEWQIIAMLAILKCGGAYVPIDPSYPEDRISFILEDSAGKLCLDKNEIETFKAEQERYSTEPVAATLSPSNLAYVIYTSGSTGYPKGVMVEHLSVVRLVEGLFREVYDKYEKPMKVGLLASVVFDASVQQIFAALLGGHQLHIVPEAVKESGHIWDYVVNQGLDLVDGTPSHLQIMTMAGDKLGRGAQQLLIGGEALTSETVDGFLSSFADVADRPQLTNVYGPTECCVDSTFYHVQEKDQHIPIGSGFAGKKVYILSEELELQPIGVAGELCISGPGVARGYLNRPELTDERFMSNPHAADERMYRTGDMGRWLPDGTIEYLGRKDDQVKVRGYRVELGEIEHHLLACDGVGHVTVLAKDLTGAGVNDLIGYVVMEEGDVGQLRTQLEAVLPAYMIPTHLVPMDSLPLTPNGKVDKHALPDPDHSVADELTYQAARNHEEEMLIAVMEEVLKRQTIGIRDNFFELGGDSIKSIQIIARLKKQGFGLKMQDILRNPEIGVLSTFLTAQSSLTMDQSEVKGEVAITPVQWAFFEASHIHQHHHFNQSLLLRCSDPIDRDILTKCLDFLTGHHDALRMVYRQRGTKWLQFNRSGKEGKRYDLSQYDLRGEQDELAKMSSIGQEIQASFELEQGPLFKIAYFQLSDGDRLGLIMHHLIIDGVSWRILLEDLSTLYDQASLNKSLNLPSKTDAYQKWARGLQDFAKTPQIQKEQAYWESQLNRSTDVVPVDVETDVTVAYDQKLSFSLSEELTQLLAEKVHGTYNTEVNDLLLTGLGLALRDVFGSKSIVVMLEGHGREDILDSIDITRTVGWFTSLYPYVLEIGEHVDDEALISIKESLRKVPNKGIGYGILAYLGDGFSTNYEPSVEFNYLGDFGDGNEDNSLAAFSYAPEEESIGVEIGSQNGSEAKLSVGGMTVSGKLSLWINYSSQNYHQSTIERLLNAYESHLSTMITRLSASKERLLTPADLTFKGLDFKELAVINESGTIEDVYQLSPLQSGIYYHWLRDASTSLYFGQIAYQYRSESIEGHVLAQAYERLIARHGVLRTSFRNDLHGQPLQVVHREIAVDSFSFEVLPPTMQEEERERYIAEKKRTDRKRGFDLDSPGQIRLQVLQIEEGIYEFIWSHHHILMDGWCMSPLVNDFYQLVDDVLGSSTFNQPLPPLYSRYIEWLDQLDSSKADAFWKEYLSGYKKLTSVPLTKLRTNRSIESKKSLGLKKVNIEGALYEQFKGFGASQGITQGNMVNGIWGYLLSQYNHTEDVVFGMVVSGRPSELLGVEQMIGLFINAIPVRVNYEKHKDSPLSLLKRLQQESIRGSDYHYQNLSDIQSLSDLGMNLLDHVLVYKNYPMEIMLSKGNNETGIRLDSVDTYEENNYSFSISITDYNTYLEITFEYDQHIFDGELISNMGDHFLTLVQSFVTSPDRKLSALGYIPFEEQETLLHTFNKSHGYGGKDVSLIDQFSEVVSRHSDTIALSYEVTELTYQQLDKVSSQLAHYIKDSYGIKPEDRIGILLERGEWQIIAMLAILKCGGAYVPIDPSYPEDRISFILEDSAGKLCLDKNEIETFKAKQERYSPEPVAATLSPSNLAYVIYTSGSTGYPKGVMVEHLSVVRLVEGLFREVYDKYEKPMKVGLLASVVFDASVQQIFAALLGGHQLHIVPEAVKESGHIWDYVVNQGLDLVDGTPSHLQIMTMAGDKLGRGAQQLLIGGEALTSENVDGFLSSFADVADRPQLTNVYGPTECCVDSTFYHVQEKDQHIPIGSGFAGKKVYILSEELELQPIGVAGELCISGPGVARGYLNRPELTDEHFISNPHAADERMYRTGDMGRWLPDGTIEYLGRKDDQVKVRGYRVELGEIEHHLLACEGVGHVTVLAKDLTGAGVNDLIGYVVMEGDVAQLRTQLEAVLPAYMIPTHLVPMDSLPLTPNGKVDKHKLAEEALIETVHDIDEDQPASEIHQQLAEIWQKVLGVDKVGISDNFFEIGGHSLKAIRLSNEYKKTFDVKISIKEFFSNPTIRDQALLVSDISVSESLTIPKAPISENYVLSDGQRRIWILSQFDNAHQAYNIPSKIRLQGDYDIQILEKVVSAIIERHEVLRTVFKENEGGEIRQWVLPSNDVKIPLEYFDLVGLGNTGKEIERLITLDSYLPFDLASGPLLRITLFKQESDIFTLYFNIHHIISDAWSAEVLQKEFFELYHAFVENKPSRLPALSIQYKDYAVWEQGLLATDRYQKEKEHWLNLLKGELPVLDIPGSKVRPKVKTYNGRRLIAKMPSTLHRRLQQFCQDNEGSLFMGLLATWQVLIYKYTANPDIIIGSPVTRRDDSVLEDQIGFYLNTLVFRNTINQQQNFDQFFDEVKETTTACFENKAYPFDRLVDDLALQRDTSRSPVFDILLTVQKGRQELMDNHAELSGILDQGECLHKFDLDVTFEEFEEAIFLTLECNVDLIPQDVSERMIGHYWQVLSSLLNNPQIPIGALDYVGLEEKELLFNTFNNKIAQYDFEETVVDLFLKQVGIRPNAIAVAFEDKTLTFSELDRQSDLLANYLMANHALSEGDLIGIKLERSHWLVMAILAILKSGAAYVPIDPDYPTERIAYIIEDSQAKLVLDEKLIASFELATTQDEKAVAINKAGRKKVAYVIYTSGSTGRPKGVTIVHEGLLNRLLWMKDELRLDEKDVLLQKTSYSFDVSVWELIMPLITGSKLVVATPGGQGDAEYLQTIIEESGVTIIHFVPSMLSAFLEDVSIGSCKTLRHVVCSGEVLPSSAVELFKQKLKSACIHNYYGPTEASIDVTSIDLTEVDTAVNGVSIGSPVPNTTLYILSDQLKLQPIGVTGEIMLGGIQLSNGYLNRPELNEERFISNPFEEGARLYCTGDIGRWLPDGTVEYISRKDDQVKVRGYRIELGEIVHQLLACDNVIQGTVIARNITDSGAELIGYLVLEKGTVDQVRRQLQHVLPSYMIPAHLIVLESLPLTPNGKLDKKALPDPVHTKPDTETYQPPRNQTEQVLVDIMKEVLKREVIGIQDNFFELGGDSIKSIQITSRLKQQGYSLKVQEILRNPEVGILSSFITSNHGDVAEQSEVTGSVLLTPVQRRFFDSSYISQRHHYNQSVLLRNSEELDLNRLVRCLDYLTAHHDALRMVYQQGADGWQQHNRALREGERFSLVEYDLRGEKDEQAKMHHMGQALQASIDLSQGPLLKAAYFRLSDGDRLGLIIHHLVIDGISWRILLEDLSSLYAQSSIGDAFVLPPKTDSYQRWASELNDLATSATMQSEHVYWQDQLTRETKALPVDRTADEVLAYDAKKSFSLPADVTQRLNEQVNGVYNTEINDLLLTTLGLALRDVFGAGAISLLLEGHGREEVLDSLDVSRTVGWFTSMYPYVLEVGELEDDMALVHVKESLRQVPNKGISYGILTWLGQGFSEKFEPSVEFNYLGDFGDRAAANGDGLFGYAAEGETIGNEIGEENGSVAQLSVGGMIISGSLNLWISYSSNQYNPSTIDRLLHAYETNLRSMIERLSSRNERLLTPSDLTYKGLSLKELNDLNANGSVEDVYPLSPLQSGIYYHWLANSSTTLYFEQVSYTLRSSIIERGVLSEAFDQLIARHGVLRTSFRNDLAGIPLQVVHKSLSEGDYFSYEVLPASMSVADTQAYITERKVADRAKGFDLGRAGQIRLLVLEIDEGLYEFIWSHHHILMDGWSISQLVGDFYQLIRSAVDESIADIPIAPRPYANYIDWLAGLDQNKSVHYWKNYLSGYSELAGIPFKQFSKTSERKLKEEQVVISGEKHRMLLDLCKETNVTQSNLIHAVWGLLLSKYNNTQDVVFGSVVSGRPPQLTGVERMIGLFINTIPFRVQYQFSDTVLDLIHRVQEMAIESTSHHYMNLSEVQSYSELGMELMDHVLVFENFPVEETLANGKEPSFQIEEVDIYEEVNYDLNIWIVPTANSWKIVFRYAEDVLHPDMVKQMSAHLSNLINSVVSRPDLSIAEVQFLDPGEELKLVHDFNEIGQRTSFESTLHGLFESQVVKTPEGIAVMDKDGNKTYEELNREANELAHYLLTETDFEVGDFVGIKLERNAQLMIAILAVLKGGGVYVPIDKQYPQERIELIEKDGNCKVLIDEPLLHRFLEHKQNLSLNDLEVSVNASSLAYIIYTSGSTGKPKGVMITHQNASELIQWADQEFDKAQFDVVYASTSHCFDLSVFEMFYPLSVGKTIRILDNALEIRKCLPLDNRVLINTVPSALQATLELEGELPEQVAMVNLAGEPFPIDLANYLVTKNIETRNLYGPSEDTTYSTCYHLPKGRTFTQAIPIGKPIANGRIYILDHQLRPQPIGIPGAIYVSGKGLARGYLNLTELNDEKFITNPFDSSERLYDTGDQGFWMSDGAIQFMGRRDDQVKIRGFRIEPGEVAFNMKAHPSVTDAYVLVRELEQGLKELIGYYVAEGEVEELRAYLKDRLPDHMVPGFLTPVDVIPLTPNGKVDKQKLPDPVDHLRSEINYVAPTNDTEKHLVAIWQDILGVQDIGIHDDFFKIGGHSLNAMKALNEIEKGLSVKLDIALLFEHPTIEHIAREVDKIKWLTPTSSNNPNETKTIEI